MEIYRGDNAGPEARKRLFVWTFTGKKPGPNSTEHVLCAPAQSKCIWTCHKSHFVWKFIGKMLEPNSAEHVFVRACAIETDGHVTRAVLCDNLLRKNAGPPGEHLD